ncbi:MAG: MMPL family transporter [Nocardioides sp.]
MKYLATNLLRPRRSWALLAVALALAGAVLVLLGEATLTPQPTDPLPAGADSTRVTELQAQLPQGDDSVAVVLFTDDQGLDEATLTSLQATFAQAAGGGGAPAELTRSEDGTAAIGAVSIPDSGAAGVADAVAELRAQLRDDLPDGVTAQVTGPAAIEADLSAVFDGADGTLLLTTAGVVALLLLLTYRSPILWIVPLAVVGTADQVAAALATHTLALVDVPWDESTVGILSVLVFGAGTDYALLLISRYRDELKLHQDRYDAIRRALSATAEAVLSSSTTVVVGLLTLLLSVFPTTRGLGLACAVGVVVAATAVLVVLPCALVVCGRWVFWPLVPRVGQPTLVDSRGLWRRVGDLVGRRPTAAIVLCVVVLGLLAAGVTQIRTGLSQADQFLDEPEAITAGERLAESFPAGFSDPTVVVTRADPAQVTSVVESVDGVSSTRPGPQVVGLAQLDVVLAAEPGSAAAQDTVDGIRQAVADLDETYVGGTEAAQMDGADGSSRDRLVIIPVILVLVVVALVLLLRSVVAPVILVASVIGTYFASLGASWLLFTRVFGFDRLDVGVPLLAFLFLVALGVDYNIFLVTRAAEESPAHGTRLGMLRALTATGGVITSAGILLAAVFAVLGVLPLVVLAQLGVIICVGVLLDTLLVRTVLVPAIAVRMGDRFWWPRRLGGPPSRDSPQQTAGFSVL